MILPLQEKIQRRLILACGLCTKRSELEERALRYGKIISMTDVDMDGTHIQVLLLTFFFDTRWS